MNEQIKEKITEVEKMKKELERKQLNIVYDFLQASSIQSLQIDVNSEYNDEGGSYLVFNITHINKKKLDVSLYDYFFEDYRDNSPDWFCSFCLENNIKQKDVEYFSELFNDFLPEELRKKIARDDINLDKLKKIIDKI